LNVDDDDKYGKISEDANCNARKVLKVCEELSPYLVHANVLLNWKPIVMNFIHKVMYSCSINKLMPLQTM
jgi:hypothetical protein